MFGVPGSGYDSTASMYSPEGRIFQCEYAKKAVEQGANSIGIRLNGTIVLVADKRVQPLQEPSSVEKIFLIDKHIAAAISGFMADARVLIREAMYHAQSHRILYDEQISTEQLVEYVSDYIAEFTQGGGTRPFGVSLIIGGIDEDDSAHLYLTDPSGTYWKYDAIAIGINNDKAMKLLEEKYSSDLSVNDAIKLALDAIHTASDRNLTAETIEIAVITKGKISLLSLDEKKKIVE